MRKEKATKSFQICWSSLAAVWPEIPSEQRFRGYIELFYNRLTEVTELLKLRVLYEYPLHSKSTPCKVQKGWTWTLQSPSTAPGDAVTLFVLLSGSTSDRSASTCHHVPMVPWDISWYIYIQYIYIRSLDNAMACHGYICKILFLYMDSHGTSWYHKESIQRCFSIKHWHVMMFMVFHG